MRLGQGARAPAPPRPRRRRRARGAHPLAGIGLAEGDRRNAGQRAFHRRRHGAGISDVLGQIGAAVDARQDEVGRVSFMIWASAIITASVGVPLTEKRLSSWRRSRTGWVRVSEWPVPDCSSLGATTQMSSRQPARDGFEQGKAAGVDPVVVGQQDAHRALAMGENASNAAIVRPAALIRQQSTPIFHSARSVLVKALGLNYRPLGDHRLIRAKSR